MKGRRSVQHHFILMLLGSTLVSVGLFLYDAWRNSSFDFAFMLWNLFLAWLPLIFALWLTRILRQRLWSSWYALIVTLLWFIFLPNSFYVITDFIHLATASRVDLLYDAVMLTSFIYTGVILGFSSLYLVHLQLLKRVSRQSASVWIGGILLACSAAIYVGRDLRWNSWDILVNPAGLLFDVSDRLLHPSAYPQMLVTIISFFVLLGSMYALIWSGINLLRPHRS